MTLEKIFIIWQCVYLTISMCGFAELTDLQLFFPSVCTVVSLIIRTVCIYKKKQEIKELRKDIMRNISEIERVIGKEDEEGN